MLVSKRTDPQQPITVSGTLKVRMENSSETFALSKVSRQVAILSGSGVTACTFLGFEKTAFALKVVSVAAFGTTLFTYCKGIGQRNTEQQQEISDLKKKLDQFKGNVVTLQNEIMEADTDKRPPNLDVLKKTSTTAQAPPIVEEA